VLGSGLNFHWPRPVESVIKVDTTRVRSTSDTVKMLTKDENIVNVEFNVQYSVADPYKFVFGVREPDETLKQAAESAVRQVIGNAEMDVVLSGERTALAIHARELLRESLDLYGTGISVSEFNFQNLRPPAEVKDAFDDVNIARADKESIENEAQAYSSKVVPEARGQAARVRAEAEGAKASSVAQAEGEAKRFSLLAEQYKAAPQVTRKRLYLETMEQVLAGVTKVVADGGNNKILMLPIERTSAGIVTLPDYTTTERAAAAVVAPPAEPARPRAERRGAREDKQ
jgi:membrane protease subunit HflK